MPTQSSSPGAKKLHRTVRNLVRKAKRSPKEEAPLPGELDPTDVQLARFFAKPAAAASSSPRTTSLASSSPGSESASSSSPTTSLASSRLKAYTSDTTSLSSDSTRSTDYDADRGVVERIDEMLLEIRPL